MLLWLLILIFSYPLLWLQEVDRFDDLEDLLKKDGFVGIHKVY